VNLTCNIVTTFDKVLSALCYPDFDILSTPLITLTLLKMAPVKNEKPAVSAFERKRLENIASNQAILKDLTTSAEKFIPKQAPKPKPTAPRKRTTPVKREASRPTRTSSRLAGVEADSETAKRKAEVEEEFAKETAKAKRQRVSGDINLSDVVAEGKKWSKENDFLSGVMRGAVPNFRTFTEEDIKVTTDESLKSLRQKMSGLELYEGYEPNRELRNIYSVDLYADQSFQRLK
jgi:hypothetical protein